MRGLSKVECIFNKFLVSVCFCCVDIRRLILFKGGVNV